MFIYNISYVEAMYIYNFVNIYIYQYVFHYTRFVYIMRLRYMCAAIKGTHYIYTYTSIYLYESSFQLLKLCANKLEFTLHCQKSRVLYFFLFLRLSRFSNAQHQGNYMFVLFCQVYHMLFMNVFPRISGWFRTYRYHAAPHKHLYIYSILSRKYP